MQIKIIIFLLTKLELLEGYNFSRYVCLSICLSIFLSKISHTAIKLTVCLSVRRLYMARVYCDKMTEDTTKQFC